MNFIIQVWAAVGAWIAAHPLVMSMVVWPALTGVISWATRKRTEAEYQAMHPRIGAALRLVGALGLDVPKTVRAIRQLVTKTPVLMPGTRVETPAEAITAPDLPHLEEIKESR